jgi:hypothetical protein
MEGTPFGYHTFMWGWLDTIEDNLPDFLPSRFIPIMFEILSRFMPYEVEIFYTSGLNKRLGTEGLSISEVAAESARRNLTI